MGRGKYEPTALERARDELFSHIRRCGVLEAEPGQREEWLTETIDFLAERYPEMGASDQEELRVIGRRYCSPAIPHGTQNARETQEAEQITVNQKENDNEPSEVSAA